MIQSPLNYTGGKYKLLPQMLPFFPKNINCFVDLFCGGCNVGINVHAQKYVYNDSCEPLINLYSVMQTLESACFLEKIETVIRRYGLSDVKSHGYDFYNCNSSDGLGAYNRDKYMRLGKLLLQFRFSHLLIKISLQIMLLLCLLTLTNCIR